MTNPVLVETLREAIVESQHRGAVAVVDADGADVLSLGDVTRSIYPRSAVKALQALPVVESGSTERFCLSNEVLALACGSHSGESVHIAVLEQWLVRLGLDTTALKCGIRWPLNRSAAQSLTRAGENPSALHNNCSGKHLGFLSVARAMGVEQSGYVERSHPVQREIKAAIESMACIELSDEYCGVDGCSVPTFAMPLRSLAYAFARFGTGHGLSVERARAAMRLRTACTTRPWYVAGTGRFCTKVMEHFHDRVFVKTGAEGVFCGVLPSLGFGIAVKCDDGAPRAAKVIMAAIIARLLPLQTDDRAVLEGWIRPTIHSWNKLPVGMLRPTATMLP